MFWTPNHPYQERRMPRPVTANDLRWLGEEADGKRGSEYVVVWKRDEPGAVERLTLALRDSAEAKENQTAIIEVSTKLEGEGGMKGDATICIRYNDQVFDFEGADCVFVTQSAFAKFVIPYYTRFRSPDQIAKMKRRYFESDNLAVLHFPPSHPLGLDANDLETPLPNVKPFLVSGGQAMVGEST